MNKEELAPGIVIYSNVIDNYESIIDNVESAVLSKITFWLKAAVRSEKKTGVDKDTRDTSIMGVTYSSNPKLDESSAAKLFYSNLGLTFFNSFDPIEKDYCNMYNVKSNSHENYGILKYEKGGKFTDHSDDHADYHRVVSTAYYLNDNYSGGEISFPRFNLVLKPKPNQMLLFPSTYTYNHSVSPVTEGIRYSVVSWIT